MKFLIFLALPLAAQISSPQLGYISHRGELRRIEGLAHSSRLSEPVASCSRLDTGARYALCTQPDGVKLIDLQTLAAAQAVPAYERILWSPNGTKAVLDSQLHDLVAAKASSVGEGIAAAVSDTGTVAMRDAQGALRLRNEIVAGSESAAAAVAFDDEALLIASGFAVRRIELGRSSQQYPLPFEPSFVASDAQAFYAANSSAIARIDRATGEVAVYEVPAEDIVISRLDRLNGGALLVAIPGEKQPGWLFRDGRFSFIPGVQEKEEAQAERVLRGIRNEVAQ